jgi:predicted dehydrogenase
MNIIHIGLGARGRHWLEVVRDLPDMRSVGCVDPDASARDWVRARFPDQKDTCYETLDEGLRHVKADAAIIASPPVLRADQAIQALEAGLTIMLEKPFAAGLVRTAQVVEASRRTGRPIIVAQGRGDTYGEGIVQQLVREGRVGTITHVSCIDRRSSPAPGDLLNQNDYAQMLATGAYHFDSLRRMLGINPVCMMARCSEAPWSPYQHGSTTEALLEMEHNIHVQYHGSLTSTRDEHTLWIEGDRGVLRTHRSRLWWRKRGWRFFLPMRTGKTLLDKAPRYAHTSMETWLNQLKAAVVERQPPDASAEDNLWTSAMVEAVMLSDKTGRSVRIDDLFRAAGLQRDDPSRNGLGSSS